MYMLDPPLKTVNDVTPAGKVMWILQLMDCRAGTSSPCDGVRSIELIAEKARNSCYWRSYSCRGKSCKLGKRTAVLPLSRNGRRGF